MRISRGGSSWWSEEGGFRDGSHRPPQAASQEPSPEKAAFQEPSPEKAAFQEPSPAITYLNTRTRTKVRPFFVVFTAPS